MSLFSILSWWGSLACSLVRIDLTITFFSPPPVVVKELPYLVHTRGVVLHKAIDVKYMYLVIITIMPSRPPRSVLRLLLLRTATPWNTPINRHRHRQTSRDKADVMGQDRLEHSNRQASRVLAFSSGPTGRRYQLKDPSSPSYDTCYPRMIKERYLPNIGLILTSSTLFSWHLPTLGTLRYLTRSILVSWALLSYTRARSSSKPTF